MMDPEDSLKVPTETITVEIALEGRTPRRVRLRLPPEPGDMSPQEAIRSRLDEEGRFLPVLDTEEDRWRLLHKEKIRWVSVPRDEEEAQLDLDLYDVRSPVRIELTCGAVLEGAFLYSPPTTRARVMDHLNESGLYLHLYQIDRVLLIGTAHVVSVVER